MNHWTSVEFFPIKAAAANHNEKPRIRECLDQFRYLGTLVTNGTFTEPRKLDHALSKEKFYKEAITFGKSCHLGADKEANKILHLEH